MTNSTEKRTSSGSSDSRYRELEKRIARIEAHLNLPPITPVQPETEHARRPENLSHTMDSLEFHIGQYWLAKAGIIVLSLGIAFLLVFPFRNMPAIFPILVGYSLVSGLFALAYLGRKSFAYLSPYFLSAGIVLLFFTTLRLHFFGDRPEISNFSIEMGLLLATLLVSIIISVKKRSAGLTALSLFLGYIIALLGNQPYFIFLMLALLSIVSVYFSLKFEWSLLLYLEIPLTYFAHFLWYINNPIISHSIKLVTSPRVNIWFILLYGVIFAFGTLLRKKDKPESGGIILTTFLNSLGCYGLFVLVTLTGFRDQLTFSHFVASVILLVIASAFWLRERSTFSTFFYAIPGYTALSMAIIFHFSQPDLFVWLCWQSLLVICTAIWFRSKIIVFANFIIYLLIFIGFLGSDGKTGYISMSFGIVSILSARVMNWQKARLELKTEFMRNAYLVTAFFTIPYALFTMVPAGYVPLSWAGAALVYYCLSLVLKNKKYRWMALLTLLLTVFYLLFIGTLKLGAGYRIISFIVLGILLLVVSLIYTRSKSKHTTGQ